MYKFEYVQVRINMLLEFLRKYCVTLNDNVWIINSK